MEEFFDDDDGPVESLGLGGEVQQGVLEEVAQLVFDEVFGPESAGFSEDVVDDLGGKNPSARIGVGKVSAESLDH